MPKGAAPLVANRAMHKAGARKQPRCHRQSNQPMAAICHPHHSPHVLPCSMPRCNALTAPSELCSTRRVPSHQAGPAARHHPHVAPTNTNHPSLNQHAPPSSEFMHILPHPCRCPNRTAAGMVPDGCTSHKLGADNFSGLKLQQASSTCGRRRSCRQRRRAWTHPGPSAPPLAGCAAC